MQKNSAEDRYKIIFTGTRVSYTQIRSHMKKDYREPEDLLSDESFLFWYSNPEQRPGNEWERWMNEGAGRKELVRQTIDLLEATVIREKDLPAGQVRQAEARLMERIDSGKLSSLSGYRHWRWIAAACILLVLAGVMVILRVRSGGQEVLVTLYGQLAVRKLPDGSEVTMNANSKVRYAHNWKEGSDREVWIEGEAFFHVQKTLDHSSFVVHADRFDVVVTGTQFNVINRPGKASVLLREGRVILTEKDGREMTMAPGDYVQWDERGLNRKLVQRDSVLAWKDRKLFFDKTPLKEVAALIEDQYGVKVKLADLAIGDSSITGIMPNNNLNVLLQSLEATTDFEVTHSDGIILIRAPAR
jgi:transmembrane sensor